jgi:hypothetical protein
MVHWAMPHHCDPFITLNDVRLTELARTLALVSMHAPQPPLLLFYNSPTWNLRKTDALENLTFPS